jgi:hypothetical protein
VEHGMLGRADALDDVEVGQGYAKPDIWKKISKYNL